MSWKNVLESSRRWSLAARLSVWYAVSTFLLLVVATAFLYWTLAVSLEREDDQYLVEKVNILAGLLDDPARNAAMVRWEVEGEAYTHPSLRVLSRVITAEAGILLEVGGMSRELPPSVFPPPARRSRGTEVRSGGKLYRAMTKEAPRGAVVQVALDLGHERTLLAQYRGELWMVLGFGLVASVLIGYRIGHGGMRPVREIAAAMRRTSSTTLGERMPAGRLPSELAALAGTFNEMLDRLEDAFARLAQFSSDIAHELRTPVNNLRLSVEVALAQARSPEEYRETLSSLAEEFVRLSRVIESLLFLARSENPQTQIQRERLDLARELASIRDYYEAPASEAGIAIDVRVGGDITADLDRTLVQRALGNLVDNALAHTPPGGAVTLSGELADGQLRISVADTGCGIPAEHLTRVFERFHRGDPVPSRRPGGLGLGLAIVSRIAALHGGRAEIASEPGRGTRVTLVFAAT